MLRCQFLCYVLKAFFFIKIALKLSFFFKKMQNFRALGAPPPVPGASDGWVLCPQTPSLRQLGSLPPAPIGLWRMEAPPPDAKISLPPIANFWLRAWWFHFWWRPFFWSAPEFGEKSVPFLVKTFFFALYLICSPKKNGGRGSSPQCWK